MSTRVTFTSRNQDAVSGAFAAAPGEGKLPAVVVVQEYWGINPNIEKTVDRLAAQGFLVLAPDLYRGALAKDAAEAGKLMGSLDPQRALADLGGALDWLKAHPRGGGKVGMIGFCMGGAYTLASACFVRGLSAAVPFYGVPGKADWSKVDVPIQAHFAKEDAWAKVSIAEDIKAQVEAAGQTMDLFVYDAQHAFMNEHRPEVFAPDAANLAWQRALGFLHAHLD